MKSPFVVAVAGLMLLCCPLRAQQSEPEAGLVALRQACLDASTDLVVLNVAAHPDDESSRTNAILRRKHGIRVVTVYTTYGDGGQNAIGREIGPELASLRVRETLRAAAMSGVEVRWLGMPDFGFSKALEETLQVWGETVSWTRCANSSGASIPTSSSRTTASRRVTATIARRSGRSARSSRNVRRRANTCRRSMRGARSSRRSSRWIRANSMRRAARPTPASRTGPGRST